MDLSGESAATQKLYGLDAPFEHTRTYARECLLARRMVERGVRFVELTIPMVDGYATILHLLGLDHERLTYRFGGRDIRLTDVSGHVVRDILA